MKGNATTYKKFPELEKLSSKSVKVVPAFHSLTSILGLCFIIGPVKPGRLSASSEQLLTNTAVELKFHDNVWSCAIKVLWNYFPGEASIFSCEYD